MHEQYLSDIEYFQHKLAQAVGIPERYLRVNRQLQLIQDAHMVYNRVNGYKNGMRYFINRHRLL